MAKIDVVLECQWLTLAELSVGWKGIDTCTWTIGDVITGLVWVTRVIRPNKQTLTFTLILCFIQRTHWKAEEE